MSLIQREWGRGEGSVFAERSRGAMPVKGTERSLPGPFPAGGERETTNGLFYDGHAALLKPSSLRVSNFREPGSAPPVSGYPGE